jgi:hypothetical protein
MKFTSCIKRKIELYLENFVLRNFTNNIIFKIIGVTMKLIDALKKIKRIEYPSTGLPVYKTVSEEISKFTKSAVPCEIHYAKIKNEKGVLYLSIGDNIIFEDFNFKETRDKVEKEFAYFQMDKTGSGKIVTSKPYLLFSFFKYIIEGLLNDDIGNFISGKTFCTSFKVQRIENDHFLNQGGRIQRNFNRELYIQELARIGFSHVEVNGLAYPMALETGPKGETYPMFYTYCPALDQFVFSDLNKGLYPYYYLKANLEYLKKNAKLAIKYGLVPGLLCFEPRSVPEEFFQKYPMLRGCRVDHPFRSFKPRYNMTITHPKVLEHYSEMLKKLMKEVPELGYMCVFTNDSGAGYEHTKSLYVGRNGGAYLIREWKNDEEIARLAGENILRFLSTLRDAASEINPDFRVITRMESFYGEHDVVWSRLGNKIDVVTNTLLARGWEVPYSHIKYPEIKEATGTIFQTMYDQREKPLMKELESRGSVAHFNFALGPYLMFEPLIGTPCPWLTFDKLQSMKSIEVAYSAHQGGITPPNLVPYNINFEILKLYQFNSDLNIDDAISEIAKRWVSITFSKKLVDAWKLAEEAIRAYPIPVVMYSTYGFTWYRLWARPLVPNIEVIAEKDRAYYEDFMCTTPHNPQNVDLMKDVLFDLTDQKRCELAIERFDKYMWTPLQRAIDLLSGTLNIIPKDHKAKAVFYDQVERLKALKIWFKTLRSVTAWIAGVHGYIETNDLKEKNRYRIIIEEMIETEIENSRELIDFIKTTKIEFMAVAKFGETPLIYGENLVENLEKRIKLMQEHLYDEAYIDPNYMWRRAEMAMV